MADFNSIKSLNPIQSAIKSGEVKFADKEKSSASGSPSFGDTVSAFLNSVNDSQKAASGKVADVIEGRSENIADAMITMEESRVSFQLMMEIRNKLLESYQEIQRMQI